MPIISILFISASQCQVCREQFTISPNMNIFVHLHMDVHFNASDEVSRLFIKLEGDKMHNYAVDVILGAVQQSHEHQPFRDVILSTTHYYKYFQNQKKKPKTLLL